MCSVFDDVSMHKETFFYSVDRTILYFVGKEATINGRYISFFPNFFDISNNPARTQAHCLRMTM